MVATVKIIPFAVLREKLDIALKAAADAIRVAPFRPLKVGLVATRLPSLKPSVMDKTRRLLEERLAPAGATLSSEVRVAHDAAKSAQPSAERQEAGDDLLVVFGASAVVDGEDVVPAGIEAAGGTVDHLGMPVDPGNLLIMGGSAPLLCSVRRVARAARRKMVLTGCSIACWPGSRLSPKTSPASGSAGC